MVSVPVSSSHFHCKVPFLISGDMVPTKPLMRRVESNNSLTNSSVMCEIQEVHLFSMKIAPDSEYMVMMLD